MADSGESTDNNSWESWLGGWVQAAKEKSSSALEMVKKDLAEFTCTIQKDTEKAVEMTKESLNTENTTHATNRVKAGLTSFLDNISRVLVIPPDDDYVAVKIAADGSGLYDRGKARLHAIQLDASTYMDPPDGPPEQYSMWLESFNMDEYKGEISELLVSKVEVRALYTKLVPSEVSHAEFWQRYFYRVHQLHCDEARKQALMKRADQTKGDSFTWDDDDDDWSGGENDEDNHSDWEKMPRPPQSLAAMVPPVTTQQSEKQYREASVEPVVGEKSHKFSSENNQNVVIQKPVARVDSDSAVLVTTCKVGGSAAELKEKIEEYVTEKTLEISMSAFAASSAQSQDEEPKPNNRILAGFPIKSDTSHDIQDASDDFISLPEPQITSADLWSLHIPNDTASASHTGQDTEYTEVVPGIYDIYRQTREGSDSCAAGGGDVSSDSDDKSGIVLADGACGITDIEESSSRPQHQVLELSPDISAASVEISSEPHLALNSGQDVSFPGFTAREEYACLPEQSSKLTPPLNSNAEIQPVSVPALTVSVAAAVEVAPVIDNLTLNSENAAECSMPETVTVTSDSVNLSQQAMGDSEKEKDPEVASHKPSPDSETPALQSLESVVLSDAAADGGEMKDIGMRLKGDMVVVGDRESPLSSESNDTKEIGLEEDWEQDFDIEVTEDDLRTAENIAKQLSENLNAGDDDWENWE